MRERIVRYGLLALLGLGLVGCGDLPELSMESVSIYTDLDANQNSATAVDLVLVYDSELVKIVSKMGAAQYFATTKQLLLDNPTLLDIWHWELVPGQVVQDFSPGQPGGKAYAGYVFANYLTAGDHRIKVAPNGIVKILLQRDDLKNLSTYDLQEARPGTTMSTAVTNPRGDQDPSEGFLGPVTDMTNKSVPCPTDSQDFQKGGQQPHGSITSSCQGKPILKKPIPIATRPLNVPPALRKNFPRHKVKHDQRKS